MVTLDPTEAAFLAERLRRLCKFAGVSIPSCDDAFICRMSGALIGNALFALEQNEPVQAEIIPSEPRMSCPYEEIVALYHELMPDNPRVKVINEARKRNIKARWTEAAKLQCAPFGYKTREDGLKAWRAFFEVCADSDFLTGKTQSWNGRPPFIADIDFIMSPSGFAKTLENKYHREVA